MSPLLVPHSHTSTDSVSADERLDFWMAHCASQILGMTVSTHDPKGLQCDMQSFGLDGVGIADVRGNQHVIERTRSLLSTHPKDSVFACIMVQGEAFVFQGGRCTQVRQGDVMVLSTAQPYMYGFSDNMRQLIVEIDASRVRYGRGDTSLKEPIPVDQRLRSGRLIASSLRRMALDFIECPEIARAPGTAEQARMLLQSVVNPYAAQEMQDSAAWRLLQAETFIAAHLHDPALDVAMVASAMNMSARQLHRVFAHSERSVSELIWECRLERAHEELVAASLRGLSVGDIAHRWGFADQAHFARAFRARYGLAPTQYRRMRAEKVHVDQRTMLC
ncbi:helix-turn-helix domain-containing protein [Comamonas humi]